MTPCKRQGCHTRAMDGADFCLDHLRESYRDKALEAKARPWPSSNPVQPPDIGVDPSMETEAPDDFFGSDVMPGGEE